MTRAKGTWGFEQCTSNNGIVETKSLQKTLRYFVSKKGVKIIKKNKTDGRTAQVEAGKWLQTVFNLYEQKPFEEYGLDYSFYLEKAHREIKAMKPELYNKQFNLFEN